MKAYWPGLLHKSEQHALHLDLHNASQIRAAHRDLVTRFGDRMTGVVIQPLAERGTELFAGVVQDEVFGPLVVFGLGGTATELLADHAARLAPLTELDVNDLLTSPRCSPCCSATPAVPPPTSVLWSSCCIGCREWPRIYPSWPTPTSTQCSPGRTGSRRSTPASGSSRATPTTRICVGCADPVPTDRGDQP